ncbi:hypothetical protein niasHT_027165 [Heterodera trifolii]|uniref:Uncharacterized protein n=1 Tax=Heterodera trifolii TaxID=157864 RepID=A0ABD2KSZ4_9BILA
MIFSGKYQWNDWGGYMASFTEQICSKEYEKIAKQKYFIDIKQELPNDIGPWKCTCHFGGVGENMTNAHLVPPTKTMKCKSALGSESEMIREEERECFNDKCGAVFCSAKNALKNEFVPKIRPVLLAKNVAVTICRDTLTGIVRAFLAKCGAT